MRAWSHPVIVAALAASVASASISPTSAPEEHHAVPAPSSAASSAAPDWGAWQLGGSVLAIAISVWAAIHASTAARRLDRQRKLEAEIHRIDTVKALTARINNNALQFHAVISNVPIKSLLYALRALGLNDLIVCRMSVEQLPTFEIPSPSLVHHVLGLPGAIGDVVDAWNSLPDPLYDKPDLNELRHALNRLMNKCDEVLDECMRELESRHL